MEAIKGDFLATVPIRELHARAAELAPTEKFVSEVVEHNVYFLHTQFRKKWNRLKMIPSLI